MPVDDIVQLPRLGPVVPNSIRAGWFGLDEHVVDGFDAWPFRDRRWYPAEDPGRWVYVTRDLMFDSIQRCIASAIGATQGDDAVLSALQSSDDVFRHLHACASSCARQLYKLGQDSDQVVAFIAAGAAAAAAPLILHPAVLMAMAEWCRDAREMAAPELQRNAVIVQRE